MLEQAAQEGDMYADFWAGAVHYTDLPPPSEAPGYQEAVGRLGQEDQADRRTRRAATRAAQGSHRNEPVQNADYACLDECLRCRRSVRPRLGDRRPVHRQVWSPRTSGPGPFNAARIWLSPSIRQ